MSCFGNDEYEDENDADGVCPECGTLTTDGRALNNCSYSPVVCDVCGHQPCDDSC